MQGLVFFGYDPAQAQLSAVAIVLHLPDPVKQMFSQKVSMQIMPKPACMFLNVSKVPCRSS